jgi:hypothetical protein
MIERTRAYETFTSLCHAKRYRSADYGNLNWVLVPKILRYALKRESKIVKKTYRGDTTKSIVKFVSN